MFAHWIPGSLVVVGSAHGPLKIAASAKLIRNVFHLGADMALLPVCCVAPKGGPPSYRAFFRGPSQDLEVADDVLAENILRRYVTMRGSECCSSSLSRHAPSPTFVLEKRIVKSPTDTAHTFQDCSCHHPLLHLKQGIHARHDAKVKICSFPSFLPPFFLLFFFFFFRSFFPPISVPLRNVLYIY